jgi:hypothetical protein
MEELLAEVKRLPLLDQRKVASVLGAVVADAASQPLHWVYNDKVMETANNQIPEFHEPPLNPFYRVPLGSSSVYGDQLMVMLRSLVSCKGYDENHYIAEFVKEFGRESRYAAAESTTFPLNGPYANRSIKRFWKELHPNGKTARDLINDDFDDPDIFPRAIPLIVLHNG